MKLNDSSDLDGSGNVANYATGSQVFDNTVTYGLGSYKPDLSWFGLLGDPVSIVNKGGYDCAYIPTGSFITINLNYDQYTNANGYISISYWLFIPTEKYDAYHDEARQYPNSTWTGHINFLSGHDVSDTIHFNFFHSYYLNNDVNNLHHDRLNINGRITQHRYIPDKGKWIHIVIGFGPGHTNYFIDKVQISDQTFNEMFSLGKENIQFHFGKDKNGVNSDASYYIRDVYVLNRSVDQYDVNNLYYNVDF